MRPSNASLDKFFEGFAVTFGIALFVVGGTAFLLIAVWPYHPSTAAGWAIFICLGLPGYLGLEHFVGRLVAAPAWGRISPPVRILLGVLVFAPLVAALAWLVHATLK